MADAGNLASKRCRVLLLTPLAPAPTGNGLAMRAALTALGLARSGELRTAVIPVSDPGVDEPRMRWIAAHSAGAVLVALPDPATAARGWLGIAATRRLVAAAQPLPGRARLASPACGDQALRLLGGARFDAVWVLRSYLAGAVTPFLDQTPRPRLVLDADEDDAAVLAAIADLHLRRGEADAAAVARGEAAAYGRLLASCLPWFDRVVAASPPEARALQRHYGLDRVEPLPNAVPLVSRSIRTPKAAADGEAKVKLVFVGNLDYLPNLDAVQRLVTRIFPSIRAALPHAELHVAGAGGSEHVARFATHDGVRLHGYLHDLGALYRDAALSVVPLRAGGGSRLKILEAFAHALPVVATPEAVAGLGVRNGEEVLVAVSDEDLASAVIRIAEDPALARDLARRALEFVSIHHDLDTSTGRVAEILALDC